MCVQRADAGAATSAAMPSTQLMVLPGRQGIACLPAPRTHCAPRSSQGVWRLQLHALTYRRQHCNLRTRKCHACLAHTHTGSVGAQRAPGGSARTAAAPRRSPKAPLLHVAHCLASNCRPTPCSRAHGVVASHPLRMRKALGSNPSVSTCPEASLPYVWTPPRCQHDGVRC